jgi:hypothetical protein
MHKPWSTRAATRSSKLGATAAPAVGMTSSEHASTIERLRPRRSDSAPHNSAPTAIAATTAETVSPAATGRTPKSRSISGRIACGE